MWNLRRRCAEILWMPGRCLQKWDWQTAKITFRRSSPDPDSCRKRRTGGEQQRVSIARAIAKNPKLLLCDEPTGALDYNTGKQILQLLQDTCRKDGITVLLITHNSALAPMADRLIRFKSGKVTEITCNAHPTPIAEIEW